jgi:hypothetical protein
MTRNDRPLATHTAAPPVVPPKRPIVGLAMADDDWRARFGEHLRQLDAARDQCEVNRLALQATLEQTPRGQGSSRQLNVKA